MRLPRIGFFRQAALGTLIAGAVVWAGSCSDVPYYWQAVGGQLEIIQKRRPIGIVLEDPAVPERIKAQLRLATRVQSFAVATLKLPEDGSYRYYADLGREYVSWLVVAAPALEMKEQTWCYPVAGCLGYRGYFHRADAEKFAGRMRAEGFDVLVRPVRAYSTLGWLDDPLLSTFVQQDQLDLMATLIHEHAHRRVWVKGDTEFNESFAVFVEKEGLRRFLGQNAQDSAIADGLTPEVLMARYGAYQADRDRFQELALAGRQRLVDLYAAPLSDADKLARKPEILAEIRRDYEKQRSSFKLLNYDDWFGPNLNNAYLAGVAQYYVRIDAFAALFDEQGRDFGKFYAACEALGRLGPAARHAELNRLTAFAASQDKRSAEGSAPHGRRSMEKPQHERVPGVAALQSPAAERLSRGSSNKGSHVPR